MAKEAEKPSSNPFERMASKKRASSEQNKPRKSEKKLKREKEKNQEDGIHQKRVEVRKKLKGKKGEAKDPIENKMKEKEEKKKKDEVSEKGGLVAAPSIMLSTLPVDEQLQFFCNQFESANKFKISSLELEPVKLTCFAQLPADVDQEVDSLCKHVKDTVGPLWKKELCDGKLQKGEMDPGSPAVLIVSASALRTLEILRGLRTLTNECRPAKLFAKHIKIDDQVAQLKNRVNIACGTPSRIKKLMDMESLGISRLSLVVLDMHRDAKGFNLLSLPQVRDEFWELYRTHLHGQLIGGELRLCFYGSILEKEFRKTHKQGK
ncbi:U3 containing 90S pre-ribosomal complex subunit [Wolffia australiana]